VPAIARGPRIGCAGWSIPAQHRAAFGDGDSGLARYASRLDAVEVNSSFYRSHQRRTYERWAASVPRNFRFSIKMPKSITHDAGLRGAMGLLDAFLDEVGGLGSRLGGVLVQLPPSLAFDARVASRFFRGLRDRTDVPVWVEPRHASWASARVLDLFDECGLERVAADPAKFAGFDTPTGAGATRYWRWHGSPRVYYSAYSDADLDRLTAMVRARGAVRSTWCIFDNTAAGHAVADALRLRQGFAAIHAERRRPDTVSVRNQSRSGAPSGKYGR
jgi:uncharacterized protein YecE (DUF72 family)